MSETDWAWVVGALAFCLALCLPGAYWLGRLHECEWWRGVVRAYGERTRAERLTAQRAFDEREARWRRWAEEWCPASAERPAPRGGLRAIFDARKDGRRA